MNTQPSPRITLDVIDIATPCPADWDAMSSVRGCRREKVRHCELCQLSVYNLAAMKRREAEQLISDHTGRLCIQLHRRADGTVVTADCSVARSLARRARAGMVLSGTLAKVVAAGTIAMVLGGVGLMRTGKWSAGAAGQWVRNLDGEAASALREFLWPSQPPQVAGGLVVPGMAIAGRVAPAPALAPAPTLAPAPAVLQGELVLGDVVETPNCDLSE